MTTTQDTAVTPADELALIHEYLSNMEVPDENDDGNEMTAAERLNVFIRYYWVMIDLVGDRGRRLREMATERTRYRTELERIAACEPAHRDRVLRVLSGEVGE